MEEVTEKNLIDKIMEKFPKFISYWDHYINYWGTGLGVSNEIMPFFDYALDTIKSENNEEIEEIFRFVEFLMCNGNNSVKDAVATCFLEDLLNQKPGEIQFIKFSKYLGKNSIDYMKGWNKLNNNHTEGL